ncbi:MAG: DNA repair exonuclease [Myxococcota bacterium]
MSQAEDDVALTLVHTADWHLGKKFPGFSPEQAKRLMRARLEVLERIFGLAEARQADAVLCAGDLFDVPMPGEEWWQGLLETLKKQQSTRDIFLLPGNHDALIDGSVWDPKACRFRAELPPHVKVVDKKNATYPLKGGATLIASPCFSVSGQEDLALALPDRAPGDEGIRIGMVHGSTFDMPGHQVPFPIAKDAAERRGLDYLAIGDTHAFREVPPDARIKTVYPSSPEPGTFDEQDAGYVALVLVKRNRSVRLEKERVAAWTWRDKLVTSLEELEAVAALPDLRKMVLRLRFDARLTPAEMETAEALLSALEGDAARPGKVGILQVDKSGLVLDPRDLATVFADAPEEVQATVRLLEAKVGTQEGAVALRAIQLLYQMMRRAS